METLRETVLVGSRVLEHYGLPVDAHDWDLVASLADAKELAWRATSKSGPRTLLFRDDREPQRKKTSATDDDIVVDLMVTTDADCSAGRRVLFSLLGDDAPTRVIPCGLMVRVPPRGCAHCTAVTCTVFRMCRRAKSTMSKRGASTCVATIHCATTWVTRRSTQPWQRTGRRKHKFLDPSLTM